MSQSRDSVMEIRLQYCTLAVVPAASAYAIHRQAALLAKGCQAH